MVENELPRGLGEKLLALRGFAPLAALPAAELALVARRSYEREFAAGQTLASEGEAVQTVQLILSGRAAVSRGGAPAGTLAAFDTVGLLPVAAGLHHTETTVALEPIQALEIDADLVDEVVEDDLALFVGILRLAAGAAVAAPVAWSAGPRAHRTPVDAGIVRRGPGEPPLLEDDALQADLAGPTGVARRLLVLRDTALFRTSPVDGLAAFAKQMDLVPLLRGEHIEIGGANGRLAVVVRGEGDLFTAGTFAERGAGRSDVAGITAIHDGHRSPAAAQPGDVVGGLESLTPGSPSFLLRARTDLQLLRGSAADLFDVIEDHHAMGRRLMADILRLTHAV